MTPKTKLALPMKNHPTRGLFNILRSVYKGTSTHLGTLHKFYLKQAKEERRVKVKETRRREKKKNIIFIFVFSHTCKIRVFG